MTFLPPLLMFASFACFSPGPNTVALAACGANYGFRRSIPYSLGVIAGRTCLQLVVITFLGVLFARSPGFQGVLRVVGSGYLLYLSYRIATAAPVDASEPKRQLTFSHAALYQFVNPKVWMNTTTAVTVFVEAADHFYVHAASLVLVFALVSLVANSVWTLFGVQIGKQLRSPGSRRAFNIAMAALNAACIVLIWV